jgi:energy-coupling factor transporter transmembrane protein EcfT
MPRTSSRPGLVLGLGLAGIVAAAVTPAGLNAQSVPPWAWPVWAAALTAGLALFRAGGVLLPEALRRLGWLLPVVALFTVPAALLAPSPTRALVAVALLTRALAATALGAGLATCLGPSGLARGVRQLGAPERLADVFEATLVSLATVLLRVQAMLRAREARRPGFGAWSAVVTAPAETVRGVGRLVAALLLRSLERAEALERARRARGGDA